MESLQAYKSNLYNLSRLANRYFDFYIRIVIRTHMVNSL